METKIEAVKTKDETATVLASMATMLRKKV